MNGPIQVAMPLNNAQTRCFMAAIMFGRPGTETVEKAVRVACEIQVETVIQDKLPEQIAREKNPEFIAKREAEIAEEQARLAASQRSGLVFANGAQMPPVAMPNRARRLQ